RERLGLGVGLAVRRVDEACGELIRLPLRAPPIAVLQRPGEPSAVLSPLNLEEAGLRIGKDPDPRPHSLAPYERRLRFVRAIVRFLSTMDCTICANERSPV
ncbi:MAG: hypothetical protein J4F34_09215, partial [Gemmatimonadetes bacterium]|nr:hypothetical protein [Gemmatimonadota bacterium]